MALLRKPPYKKFLAVEVLCKIGHESAAGNIWIRPFSTDILSDPVDDEIAELKRRIAHLEGALHILLQQEEAQ